MSTPEEYARYRRYYEKNREKILARNYAWAKDHPEVFRKAGKKYRDRNPEKVREARRASGAKRRPEAAAYARHRIATDPQFRIRNRCRVRLWRALKYGNPSGSIVGLIGCTIEQFREHIEGQFVDGMTWDNYGEWHMDHIVPIVAFDLTDSDGLAAAWHFTNTRPLWGRENQTKGARCV